MKSPVLVTTRWTLFLKFLNRLGLLILLATLPVLIYSWAVDSDLASTFSLLIFSGLFLSPVLIYWLGRVLISFVNSFIDLLAGPRLLMGYVTYRDALVRPGFWRADGKTRYILNIVPAEAFDTWRGKHQQEAPDVFEDAVFRYEPESGTIATSLGSENFAPVTAIANKSAPVSLKVPTWVYEKVRLGDLVQLVYTQRNQLIFQVEVILSLPLNEPVP